MSAMRVLLSDAARSWFSAKGFWIVLVAALVPSLLTGSWALTHQQDLSPLEVSYGPGDLEAGVPTNITATVANVWDRTAPPSNATLEVGYFEPAATGGLVFRSRHSETFQVPRLEPGQEHSFTTTWTAEAGTFIFRVRTDVDDAVREIEENNNHRFVQVQVPFPRPEEPPTPPELDDANGTTVDLRVVDVAWPAEVYLGDTANVTVTVRNAGDAQVANATVQLRVHRGMTLGTTRSYTAVPDHTESLEVTLGPQEQQDLTFAWTPSRVALYAAVGSVLPPAGMQEGHADDNTQYQETFVDRRFAYEPPEPKATAKAFYHTVLEVLHIRLLVPLIALFYAGSLLEEERRKGNLSYLLTRPVPRWLLPVTRSIVSLVVGGSAVALGIVATFVLLLGMPQEAPGFLWNPLLLTLLALFAYTGLWTALGVLVQRPTLWGLAWVLGWETFVFVGRNLVTLNGAPLVAEWFLNLSIAHWMTKALAGWDAATGWTGAEATVAALVVAGIGVAGIAAAAWGMQRREFAA